MSVMLQVNAPKSRNIIQNTQIRKRSLTVSHSKNLPYQYTLSAPSNDRGRTDYNSLLTPTAPQESYTHPAPLTPTAPQESYTQPAPLTPTAPLESYHHPAPLTPTAPPEYYTQPAPLSSTASSFAIIPGTTPTTSVHRNSFLKPISVSKNAAYQIPNNSTNQTTIKLAPSQGFKRKSLQIRDFFKNILPGNKKKKLNP